MFKPVQLQFNPSFFLVSFLEGIPSDTINELIKLTSTPKDTFNGINAFSDSELVGNTVPTNCFNRLDELIGGKLSKIIGAAAIPTAWFYDKKRWESLHRVAHWPLKISHYQTLHCLNGV